VRERHEYADTGVDPFRHSLLRRANQISMNRFAILDGLPPYGPSAIQFSSTGQGQHREGLVIEFFPKTEASWVGNFQRGESRYDEVLDHPDRQHIIVVAGGQAYVVNPLSKGLHEGFGGQIEYAESAPDLNAVILGNGLWIETVLASETVRTKRLSWDGMGSIERQGQFLSGQAYDAIGEKWVPFSVDLLTGVVSGGSEWSRS
jgi:hypothetical protein